VAKSRFEPGRTVQKAASNLEREQQWQADERVGRLSRVLLDKERQTIRPTVALAWHCWANPGEILQACGH
jgi:hypothetical protein